MSINYVETGNQSDKKNGCFPVILFLFTLIVAIVEMFYVKGFWLGCGMFFTIMVGGMMGGGLGLKITAIP